MSKENAQVILCEELSMSRMAMAQIICNYERRYEYVSWESIAKSWLEYSAQMNCQEWHSARDALLHYLRLQKSKSALAAIEILTSPESGYARNAQLFKGVYRQRKIKSDETYREASNQLISERLGVSGEPPQPDLHGATTEAFGIIRQFVEAWKSRIVGVIR